MPPAVTINMRTPEGRIVAVPADELRDAVRAGYEPETTQEKEERIGREVVAERQSGILPSIEAGVAGGLRGASLGLFDVAAGAFGTAEDVEHLRELQEAHPTISTLSEIGGNVIPALGTGGGSLGLTPAGIVGRVGAGIVERGAAKGGIAKVAGYVGAGALEGAAGNAGSYISDVALGKRDLSAEGFVAAAGKGALFGAAAGGAALGIEKGAIQARKLFSKADIADEAALEAAESAAARDSDEIFAAGDDMAAKARDLVKQERLRKAQVSAEREEVKLATDRALGEQKLATQKALDDLRIEKARTGRKAKEPSVETIEPAGAVDLGAKPTEAALDVATEVAQGQAPSSWTPGALDDSAQLAAMLGQTPKAAKLEKAAAAYEAAAKDARDWVRTMRGDLAKKSGGTITTETRAATRAERGAPSFTHPYRHKLPGRTFDETGAEVAAGMSDEVRAFDMPIDQDFLESYDDLLNRAAVETDDVAKDALLREAAELEEGTLNGVAGKTELETLAARERMGISHVDVARKRAAERADLLGSMTERDAAAHVTGAPAPPFKPRPMSDRGRDAARFDALVRNTPTPSQPFTGLDANGNPIRLGLGFEDAMAVPRFERKAFSEEAYEAYEVLGRYEKATADLVAEMGEAAPPKMRQVAEGYQSALGDQERKLVERSAQLGDDVAAGASGAAPTPKKSRTGKARAAAEKAKPIMDRLADVGSALEALQTAGVPGIPDVDKLPVIGPVLGLWLKTRAVRKLLFGRDASRVAATGESRAAAMAARVRDRAADAVDRLLAATPAAARKVRAPVAMTGAKAIDTLRHSLFDDGVDRPAPKNDVEATLARVEELSAAMANPGQVKAQIRRSLHDASDPDLIRAASEVYQRKLGYLAQYMPKSPPPTLLGSDGRWTPSKSEIQSFALRMGAAEDPAAVLEKLAVGGVVTEEEADTLRNVYPQIYAEASTRLMQRAAELEKELPYQKVLRLGVLFDAPLVESLIPERIAALQKAAGSLAPGTAQQSAATMSGPQPAGLSRPPDLGNLYMTASDRRATRR